MAKAVILEKRQGILKKILLKKYPVATIKYRSKKVKINDIVPFRIKFTNIGIPGYGPNNIPGIGLQVIGYSNYIL